ncbi:MAG: DUF4230 domain-containing protein [Fischerella sp.]|nr:DUF4230 domain-containing protein [Fischerella sp.]
MLKKISLGVLLLFAGWASAKFVAPYINYSLHRDRPPSELVIKQIQELSELATVRMLSEVVIPVRVENKILGQIVGVTSYLYIVRGQVLAGVDLSQIGTNNVAVFGDKIEIQLPVPRILDAKVDVSRSEVAEYHKDWLAPDISPASAQQVQQRGLAAVVKQACENDVLALANRQATFTVSRLVGLTNQKIAVKTTKPENCNYQPTSSNSDRNRTQLQFINIKPHL